MTSPKNFNKIESDVHQMLGDIKIQEICHWKTFPNYWLLIIGFRQKVISGFFWKEV